MDGPESPGGGTPRKSLWRSASWSARSSPTTVTASAAGTGTSTSSSTKPRPAPLHLPPLSISRCPRAWPLPAPADTSSSTHSPAASSLVDGDLSRVTDHIYLGGDAAARDRDLLRRHGITHVLNCAGFACPQRFAGELRYRTLWLRDHPGEDITSLLYGAFDFLEEARGRGRALVHCSRGTSRSAAVVAAYLMWRSAIPFEDALRLVRAARPAADPNPGFACQLLHWQRRVLAPLPLPSRHEASSPRVYRMAPHSPYDPLHLVPKAVDRTGPAELDSRGAFLVHAPAAGWGAVYVWVGQECEPAMEAAARAAARQLLRYERARGPVVATGEGSEPAEFWEALGCDLSTAARVRRRVESYDLDFEIYRRALKGGSAAAAAAPTLSPEVGGTTPRMAESPNNGDRVDAAAPFGSPSSLSAGTPTSTDGSTLFTSSPVSSTSDWYNSSPGSDLSFGEARSLCSPRPPLPRPCGPSLAERRGGPAPSQLLRAHIAESENAGDAVKDWPFSPYSLAREEDNEPMDIDQAAPSDLGRTVEVEEATLYHLQPCLQKVEMLHPGVLDSGSAFLLLAPKRSSDSGETKTLFVWVGKDFHLTHGIDGHGGGVEDEDGQAYFKRIAIDFLNQMTLPVDIPVQVIREDEEPEEFLNHLFTFHQTKETSKS